MADKNPLDKFKKVVDKQLPELNKGISRRGFLKGSGLATAGALAATTGVFANMPTETTKVIGPDEVLLKLSINEKEITVPARPDETLVEVLRDRLDLTGTKLVCGRGACSACTIMVDDTPVCSCLTLAVESEGVHIKTIEGVAKGEELHPVQQAFIDEDASMCGYCTPGMVMSCVALLDRNASPSELEVKKAVRGNLCRCGTYPHVFKAAMAASKMS